MEYCTVNLRLSQKDQETILSQMAKEGWELVCVSYNLAYMKRKKERNIK
jgi:hypothetical protein